MKRISLVSMLLIISILVGMDSCNVAKVDPAATPLVDLYAQGLFGSWKFKSYADGITFPYEVTMEIKNEKNQDGLLTVSGRSSVNFYFASLAFDSKTKKITFSNIGGTKIAGTADATKFERDYYAHLAKIETYEFKDANNLQLTMPTDTSKYLLFEKVN